MSDVVPQLLGLIAGAGRFPLDIADSARRCGARVVAVAFHGHTDARIAAAASNVTWLHPGEVGAAISALRSAGVCDAVMAGKLPKAALASAPESLRLDGEARALLAGLASRGDAVLLHALAEYLESRGIRLRDQTELLPELLGGRGPLGKHQPSPAQWAQIAFGWPLARRFADSDVGQTVAVKDGCVLAVEAVEGTDAAIARAGEFAAGACVVKVARRDPDFRFDLPAIGPDTVAALTAARASALAFEAFRTVVLARAETVVAANRAGIALVGVVEGDFGSPA